MNGFNSLKKIKNDEKCEWKISSLLIVNTKYLYNDMPIINFKMFKEFDPK